MGFFDEAEVEVNDIPDDPFGFGKSHWLIQIDDIKDPKPTAGGDKFGMSIIWKCIDPEAPQEKLGNGNWIQLPVPVKLRDEIPWENKSPEAKKVLHALANMYEALGFSKDEYGSIGKDELIGRHCMAKISVKQNAEGFWQFNIFALRKPNDGDGSDSGFGEFSKKPAGKSEEDLLNDELNS